MKTTPFTDIHIALGAKMHEFAGYNMPIEYSGIMDEHQTVCQSAGLFDVSHMGEFYISGANAYDFVQQITSNDISRLAIGRCQYTCFVNEQGGVVDDLIVYRTKGEEYLMVVNASNIEKDWLWCNSHNPMGACLDNKSDQTGQLALQGPKALAILQKLTDIDLSSLPYYQFTYGKVSTVDNVLISNTGYTGAGGFEVYFPFDKGKSLWEAIMQAGAEFDIKPIGLGARDTLRLEMGYPLYGHELSDDISPLEAGLGWITKLTEGNHFVGREKVEAVKQAGPQKLLCGFELIEKGIPRQGYEIRNKNEETIGYVSSGTISPLSKIGIGMGFVAAEYAQPGERIYINVRNKNLKAFIVKPPFRK